MDYSANQPAQPPSDQARGGVTKSTRQRKHSSRACLECRKRHTKCDGKAICTNCQVNNRQCEYVTSKRGGFRIPKSVLQQQQQQQQQQNTHPSISIPANQQPQNALQSQDFSYPSPRSYSNSPPEETEWERVIRIYYESFHDYHPVFPPRESRYLNNLKDKDDLEAILKVISLLPEQTSANGSKEMFLYHCSKIEKLIDSAPKDLINIQACTLATVVYHIFENPPKANEYRQRAVNMVLKNNLKSRRVCDTTSFVNTVHELYCLDVSVSAIAGQRSLLSTSGLLTTMKQPDELGGKIRYQVVNLVDRIISEQLPEAYFRSLISSWDEVFKSMDFANDTTNCFSYMCLNYCVIMMNMPDSSLCQSQYPIVLSCPSDDPELKQCEQNMREQFKNNPKDPGDTSVQDRACITAANNMVRSAQCLQSGPPLVCCAVSMAFLVLIKAYDLLSNETGQDDFVRKLEMEQIAKNVQKCSEYLCKAGKIWPLPKTLNVRLREVVFQNMPELYSYTCDESTCLMEGVPTSTPGDDSASTTSSIPSAAPSAESMNPAPFDPSMFSTVGVDFLQLLDIL